MTVSAFSWAVYLWLDLRDGYYEELELVIHQFPKNHMTVPLGNFNTKLEGGNIFKPTVGNEVLHEDS